MGITSGPSELDFDHPTGDTLLVRLAGSWKIGQQLPSADEVERQVESAPEIRRISFDTKDLGVWDSGLLTFLIKVIDQCSRRNIDTEKEGLPQGVQRLIALATAVPEKKDARQHLKQESFLGHVGGEAIKFVRSTGELITFIGEACVATARLVMGKARFRPLDLRLFLQESGAQGNYPVEALWGRDLRSRSSGDRHGP
jgi:phospholipid/cholesterol/gamma-HCH transport system permease protein